MASPSDLKIDAVCDAFEKAWQSGRPALAEFLTRVEERLRELLALELLTIERQVRISRGEQPNRQEYKTLEEFIPAAVLDQVFPDSEPEKLNPELPWIFDTLSSCPALSGLRPDLIRRLAQLFRVRTHEVGELLLEQGQPSTGLHLLLSGIVEIRSRAPNSDGQIIDQSGKGAVLGEMSLVTDSNCTADVKVILPVRTLTLSADDYRKLRCEFPEFEVILGELVAQRLGSRDWDAFCGKTINGYHLERCLRRGGMGVVYGAVRLQDNKPFALKMLRHSLIHDDAAVLRFQQEGQLLINLRHPNIVAVHDYFFEYRTLFLVMDLCDGEDLGSLVNAPLAEPTVRRLLGQVAAALDFAHEQGIIHLDLKPANILVNRQGDALLADFGLSRAVDCKAGETASLAGTPRYMSPEQMSALSVDRQSDWYSFACLGYELMVGKPLFAEPDMIALAQAKANFHPRTIELPISDELQGVLEGALQPLPEHRQLDLAAIAQWAGAVPELHG